MSDDPVLEQLKKLEERIASIEDHLGIGPVVKEHPPAAETLHTSPEVTASVHEDDLEFEVGQKWFAKVGIVVMALGIVFLLTFPYSDMPAIVPGLFGYVLVAGLFLLAHLWRHSFESISRYLRGAAMALLFFTTLRLFYFGTGPALMAGSPIGIILFVMVVAVNLVIGFRRQSPYLFALALTTGFAATIAVGSTLLLLTAALMLCIVTIYAHVRYEWPGVLLYGTALTYLTYCIWMLNNPILGNEIKVVNSSVVSIYLLLAYALILASGTFLRQHREKETIIEFIASLFNGGFCYALFLIHTLAGFPSAILQTHLSASLVFLGAAIAFWVSEKSRYSTFVYAMLGYMALSAAIISAFPVPGLFVWLSGQSILVVATAILFRSRFIVVANFVMYLVMVIGYMVVAKEETGISIWFGIVALASARILNWQQDRLELKTELMRNAYLAGAFIVFPYALYHLVPHGYVSLAWVGIALFYYLMNLIIKAQKYRWMGHLTLILTVLYVLIIGIFQLEPTYRILSFLILGAVLLITSLVFTRLRKGKRSEQ